MIQSKLLANYALESVLAVTNKFLILNLHSRIIIPRIGGRRMSLVYVKNKKNGVTYVYESSGYWDKEKQQARNRRKCIGKVDPVTGEIIPSKKKSVNDEASLPKQRGPVPSVVCTRSFYGATYFFNAIGEKLGVTDDLRRCFPDSYKQILSIAYYLVMEDRNPLSRFPKWALTHTHPFNKDIPSQRSSELFGSIDEDAKQNFFLLQGQRRLEEEFLLLILIFSSWIR